MKILAVDPGYERLGVAILEKPEGGKESLIFSDCIVTSKDLPHSERLNFAGSELMKIIKEYKPEALAIETLFFSKNQKTALSVAEARGMILFVAAYNGLVVHEFSPADIKIAVTGHGRSDKSQVTAMVNRILKIDKPIKYDDEYDAIAAGITYFAMQKSLIHRK
jgi:crossover junction endodeoxyribonuclease RuvC